jgi:hypothetical protein
VGERFPYKYMKESSFKMLKWMKRMEGMRWGGERNDQI